MVTKSDLRRRIDGDFVSILLDGAVALAVDELRRRWDPIMSALLPAHVTVVYDQEMDRVAAPPGPPAAIEFQPFRLHLGRLVCLDHGAGGIFCEVEDRDGGWQALRRTLTAPGRRIDVVPHVTIVHPVTARDGRRAWRHLRGAAVDREFTVVAVKHTRTRGGTFSTVRTHRARASP